MTGSTGNFSGDEFLTAVFTPTHNTNITIYAGSTNKKTFIDNLTIERLTLIDRDTDFAIPPGIHEMVVPKGVGDKMLLTVLPYNNYTDVLGAQFMRVVKHG